MTLLVDTAVKELRPSSRGHAGQLPRLAEVAAPPHAGYVNDLSSVGEAVVLPLRTAHARARAQPAGGSATLPRYRMP
ncbi:hypothetical protein [Asanoa sp. NPDC050611]|uniref:hypothetical protein n=1 Tax=Asanoa sp. NPDC050611 TaxID=3157098 RepID=UPI0033EE6BB3